jgi:hypothetical protein
MENNRLEFGISQPTPIQVQALRFERKEYSGIPDSPFPTFLKVFPSHHKHFSALHQRTLSSQKFNLEAEEE